MKSLKTNEKFTCLASREQKKTKVVFVKGLMEPANVEWGETTIKY